MFKKNCLLAGLIMLGACHTTPATFVRYCPNVQIVPEFSHVTLMSGKQQEAKIELIGYEGYCHENKRGELEALIAPIFEIQRQNINSDNLIEFGYYTDTGTQQDTIGKEAHFINVEVKEVKKKIMHQGDYISVKIPNDRPGYPIKLGLVLSRDQYRYNRLNGLR